MARITHPIVRGKLAQLLHDEFGVPSGTKAVNTAQKLIDALHARNMDVVMGDWMAGDKKEGFDWNDLASLVDELEERHPWNPVELR